MADESQAPFQVVYSEVIKALFVALVEKAEEVGEKDYVLDAARTIDFRLHNDPRDFGEPLNTLHNAKLEIRHGGEGPLLVTWGVHQEKKLVFVRDYRLLRYQR